MDKKRAKWEKSFNDSISRHPERLKKFMTTSSVEINRLYTPEDLKDFSQENDLGFPGQFSQRLDRISRSTHLNLLFSRTKAVQLGIFPSSTSNGLPSVYETHSGGHLLSK